MSEKTMSEVVKEWKRRVAGKRCGCGAAATRYKDGFVCERCEALETYRAHLALRSVELRSEGARRPARPAVAPDRRGPTEFVAQVVDLGTELVVCGHGRYCLKVTA